MRRRVRILAMSSLGTLSSIIISLCALTPFTEAASPAWDGLKVTFGLNPFDPINFASLPRTVAEATASGWKLDASVTCGSRGPYRGNRYLASNGDTSAMLLFDRNGYIAGIQAGISKSIANNYPAPNKFSTWTEEGDKWTITAYFVEPAIICTSGRSSQDYAQQGTGMSLIIQSGSNPVTDLTRIPNNELDLVGTQWTKGKCFFWMGMHYWYNMTVNMSADDFYPAFLQYNNGKLNGFGWAFTTYLTNRRYEHPPKSHFSAFMQQTPTFLQNPRYDVTTLHVYMTSTPRSNYC